MNTQRKQAKLIQKGEKEAQEFLIELKEVIENLLLAQRRAVSSSVFKKRKKLSFFVYIDRTIEWLEAANKRMKILQEYMPQIIPALEWRLGNATDEHKLDAIKKILYKDKMQEILEKLKAMKSLGEMDSPGQSQEYWDEKGQNIASYLKYLNRLQKRIEEFVALTSKYKNVGNI